MKQVMQEELSSYGIASIAEISGVSYARTNAAGARLRSVPEDRVPEVEDSLTRVSSRYMAILTKRKNMLDRALNELLELFKDRVLPFDTDAARHYADLAVTAKNGGRGFPTADGYMRPLQHRGASWWHHATHRPIKRPA